jgi:hypothetical protein
MTTQFQSLVGDLVPTPETPATPASVETPSLVEGDTVVKESAGAQTQTGSVPLPVFMEVKHDLNDLRKENAALRQQFESLRQPSVPAPETPAPTAKPDPLKVHIDKYTKEFVEENGHAPELSDIPVPADVLLARDQWRDDMTLQDQERKASDIRKNAIQIASTRTMTDASFGPGLGLDAIVAVGHKYLTQGDKLDISESGEQCPVVMYRKCLERAIQSGTPEGAELARKVSARFQEEKRSGATPESLASITPPNDKQVETPPVSADAAIGRHPHLARLGLKGYGRSA